MTDTSKSWVKRFLDWWFPPKNYFVVEASSAGEAINLSGLPKPGEMYKGKQLRLIRSTSTLSKSLYVVEYEFAWKPLVKRYEMNNAMQLSERWE